MSTPRPAPKVDLAAARVCAFDLPGVAVGVAEYEEGPTGCTVVHFARGASCKLDVRGGMAGILGDYGYAHAICLAGGSLLGLEAATGAAAELFERAGRKSDLGSIPIVTGGIIYDFGPRWGNPIYPDRELGQAALRAASPARIPLGARGAGRSATVGKGFDFRRGEPAGQGAAFRRIGETRLLFLTVVNAMGAIHDRQGNVVRGNRDRTTGKRKSLSAELEHRVRDSTAAHAQPGNTTLSVLVTNKGLDGRELEQLGRAVHASMARAIQPFHTIQDGDALWCATTSEVDDPTLDVAALSVLGGELAWDAVLASFDPT